MLKNKKGPHRMMRAFFSLKMVFIPRSGIPSFMNVLFEK